MSISLGTTLATNAINEAMNNRRFHLFVQRSLQHHFTGDWGDCCDDDSASNDYASKNGLRILSVYHIPQEIKHLNHYGNEKIWIITEANRSATTILYPSEY